MSSCWGSGRESIIKLYKKTFKGVGNFYILNVVAVKWIYTTAKIQNIQ